MLGPDVNNLDHLPLTLSLTNGFLRGCRTPHAEWVGPVPPWAQFSEFEERVLKVTAPTHDWGEAGKVGDVMWHLKTDEDEVQEALDLQDIILDVVPEYRRLPELRQVAEILADKQGETKLGRAFNTIERMGYMRTSLRAWEIRTQSDDPELNGSLDFMSHQPFCDHVPVLLERAETYPATDAFLRDRLGRLLAVIEGHRDRVDELAPQYARFTKEDDTRRETFAEDFAATARLLTDRYAVDGLPVSA